MPLTLLATRRGLQDADAPRTSGLESCCSGAHQPLAAAARTSPHFAAVSRPPRTRLHGWCSDARESKPLRAYLRSTELRPTKSAETMGRRNPPGWGGLHKGRSSRRLSHCVPWGARSSPGRHCGFKTCSPHVGRARALCRRCWDAVRSYGSSGSEFTPGEGLGSAKRKPLSCGPSLRTMRR